jgi:hypothetical protein
MEPVAGIICCFRRKSPNSRKTAANLEYAELVA